MRLYLAGPMRGLPKFNFPAFDGAAAALRNAGYRYVVNPADLDRAVGFDETATREVGDDFVAGAMRRDISALLMVDAVVLLPGWRDSAGTKIEVTIAEALALPLFEYANEDGAARLDPVTEESVLLEAERIVNGPRRDFYGHPARNFGDIGRVWGVILERWRTSNERDVPASLVGLCMVGLKLARQANRSQRDNLVDMAGYAENVRMIDEAERADKDVSKDDPA